MKTFLGDETAEQKFIAQAVELVAARKADGASLDFEPVARWPPGLRSSWRSSPEFRTAMKARFPSAALVNADVRRRDRGDRQGRRTRTSTARWS